MLLPEPWRLLIEFSDFRATFGPLSVALSMPYALNDLYPLASSSPLSPGLKFVRRRFYWLGGSTLLLSPPDRFYDDVAVGAVPRLKDLETPLFYSFG